jgi:PadR family transcriptional regulator, regulatory protein AphA
MSSGTRLTTTTHGVLGLLAVRPHSTYELAKAMDRSVGRVWPRAKSKLFEEPKKLVHHGYATAEEDAVGRRLRTIYTITPAGRRALRAWLAEPGDGPALEFEGLVKLIFADLGTRDAALASIARARQWAIDQNVGNIEAGEKFLTAEDGLYAGRRATTLLLGAFLTDFYKLVADWADWATDEVEDWPDDISSHRIAPSRTREVLARARWSENKQPG